MQTKQQKRASFVLNQLNNSFSPNGTVTVDSKTATFIVGTPNMVLSNGLGQTMAFLMAKMKDKPERKFVFETIKKYLEENYKNTFTPQADNFVFIQKFSTISSGDYIKIQDEVLRMLEWLKRYARAFEKEEEKNAK